MKKVFWGLFVFIAFSAFADEDKKSYFDEHEQGWHWYKATPEEKPEVEKDSKQNPLEKAKSLTPMEELKQYQKRLEEAKALAVMHPNRENIAQYQYLQYEAMERAQKFSTIWMENVFKNPELNYARISPTSQNARHIYLQEQTKKKEQKIHELSKTYGLFFFFKNGCAYCDAFAPIVKKFSEKYHWEVLAISEFGERNELFERNVKDNGLAQTWGVKMYPSLFAVNPKTGHVIPISDGMISIEEMEDRIMVITQEESDEKYS